MLVMKTGNLFDSDSKVLAHGVNLAGVMGAGIAKEFKSRFPGNYKLYKEACEKGELRPGDAFLVREGVLIANLASQVKPGRNANIHLVRSSVTSMLQSMDMLGVNSVALPRIGCGIGGLEWEEVEKVLQELSEDFPGITMELWTLPE